MNDLRTAAQQALEALGSSLYPQARQMAAIAALKAALAEPVLNPAPGYCKHCKQYTIEEPLPAEPVQEPVAFDHGIGADRFKVVRGAFWWHVLIGDSPTEHGKFRSRASAEKMAADLLREFRNGAFVQHEAALAEPVQQGCEHCNQPLYAAIKCRVCGRAHGIGGAA